MRWIAFACLLRRSSSPESDRARSGPASLAPVAPIARVTRIDRIARVDGPSASITGRARSAPRRVALLATLLLASSATTRATADELRLPSILGDHMVLQQSSNVTLWGWAEPGAAVEAEASWGGRAGPVLAAADGRWSATLVTPEAGGPFELVLRSGEASITLTDVLVGEVWLNGGQSNMEWTVAPGVGDGVADWEAEVARAEHPALRVFSVRRQVSATPAADCVGEWVVVSPQTVGAVSATAYFFGRDLSAELGRPVGLVCSSWGGTRAEVWTSPDGLAPLPEFAHALARLEGHRTDPEGAAQAEHAAWFAALDARDPGVSGRWMDPALDDRSWPRVPTAFRFADHELDGFDGTLWLRGRLVVPDAWAGRDAVLHIGPIDDMDQAWLDGEPLAVTEVMGQWNQPRAYAVSGARLAAGEHLLTIRVIDTGGAGGLAGEGDDALTLRPVDDGQGASDAGGHDGGARDAGAADAGAHPSHDGGAATPAGPALHLSDGWALYPGTNLAGLGAFPSAGLDADTPTALFQGMIAPLGPLALAGVNFYQGESNRLEAELYQRLFPALIADWRAHFARPELPFHFVQIAPYAYDGDTGQAAELRVAQSMALALPHTGMVVTTDIGDPGDIHPKNKQEVGRRLCLWALHAVYGRDDVLPSGPIFAGVGRENGKLRLGFRWAQGWLSTRDGLPVSHLEIAGADRVYVPAQGRIEGKSLLVWSDDVPAPLSARYAWGAADEPNLAGPTGLPASPFRTPAW